MAERHREEVLNTFLALCLGGRGMDADPETILRRGRSKPDVIATFRGLRCAVEGKVDYGPAARVEVAGDARSRIDQGIAHLAIAVVYPARLRTTAFDELPAVISSVTLQFSVLTDAGESSWHGGGVTELVAELRRAHDVIVRDDVLQQAVDTLNVGLAEVSNALLGSAATCDRLITLLGVGARADGKAAV